MQIWFPFYTVVGGAAATLLGLLFVAVSLNAPATLGVGREPSRRLAEQAFHNYVTVLLVALLALFPGTSARDFGVSTLSVTAISAIWGVARFYLAAVTPNAGRERVYSIRRHLTSLIGFGLLIASAVLMLITGQDHRGMTAAALMILLASATTVSWELLTRIAKTPGG